ncbi:SusC/RagA family TonB-linked outer membrane protein [Algibacter lectus]|uniref:SusC/RagA family TonB-linked outer membrane protein n=1 Tax=Algibacter lectus TaxID=221126 RepID=UPI0026EE558D|nr:TonB-dependent receptor [Algibacter lectus]MDO7135966.1 TonB-dependent receptor [Algibacter lectus]
MKLKNLFNSKNLLSRFLLIMFLVLHSGLFAQTGSITVKGIITGDDGMPIPGAAVLVLKEGKPVGAVSDFDGNYAVEAAIGDQLVFSYVGMASKTVTVTSTQLNVTLSEELSQLNEVVVIGYGSVKKKELTGAVVSVKSEDLEKIVTSDLASALQGQAAGVNVVTSSTPGGDSEILIRGITTLEDNTPLYVVDGIIQEGDPRIAPSDVESINILKDAASTAIYGSRGATGVILITTKQGKPGTLQVRLNASYAIQNRRAAVPLMNSVEQTYFDIVTLRNTQGAFDEDAGASLPLTLQPYNFQNETDLNELVFNNNAPTENYNLNVSGGSNDITYNVNFGFFNQEGLQRNSAYERFNTRANTVYEKDKLRIQTSLGLSIDKRDIPVGNLLSQAIVYKPTQNGLDADNFDDLDAGNGPEVNTLGWVVESLQIKQDSKAVRANASVRIDYDILDDLKLSVNSGLTSTNTYGSGFKPFQARFTSTGNPQNNPNSSYIRRNSAFRTSLSVDAGLTYKKQIDDHGLTFTLFATTERYKNEAFAAEKLGVTNPEGYVFDLATGTESVTSGFDYTDTRIGTIGRVQYNYKGRYLLSSSIRRDGSSKFGADNQWGTFPSVSAAWNISDEPFWKSLKKTVNNFRLRLSNGSVGNDRIRSYSFSPGIEQDINYVGFNGTNESLNLGSSQVNFANELLKWETTTTSNVGIDLGFFKNKLTVAAEYYYADKKDMLFPVFLPLSAGGPDNASVTLNVGNMTNKGAELTVGYRGKTGKLNWRMNGTFSTNENEITKIDGDTDFLFTNDFGLVGRASDQSRVTALAVGREAGAFYLWTTNGIADTEEKLANYQLLDSNARMGDVMFNDNNPDGVLDDNDRVYSGSGLPKYEIGYTFSANYKSFDFSMNWYAALGQEIMNGFNAWSYGFGRHKDLLYQWSEANPVTPIPTYRQDIRNHRNFIGYSDLWLEDGSYLRLRQVQVGYSLPKKVSDKLGINRLRLYVSAQNALTLTKYSGYNPEVGGGIAGRGLDKGTGPTSAQYLFGMNFNF